MLLWSIMMMLKAWLEDEHQSPKLKKSISLIHQGNTINDYAIYYGLTSKTTLSFLAPLLQNRNIYKT